MRSAPSRQASLRRTSRRGLRKTTFTGLWNAIAVRYGLPTYRQDEL